MKLRHHASIAVLFAVVSLSGCKNREALKKLESLEPRAAALRAKLHALETVLPAPGKEQPLSCATPVAAPVHTLDEARAMTIGGVPRETKVSDLQVTFNNSAFNALDSSANLEKLRSSNGLGVHVSLLESRLPLAEAAKHLLILRTDDFDRGQIAGSEITRHATWKGWGFLVSVDPPQLLGAWSVGARSADSIKGKVTKGLERTLLASNVTEAVKAEMAREAQERCGARVVFNQE